MIKNTQKYIIGVDGGGADTVAALANKLSKKSEWEFNEWLHGKTGKPMGARFQSWSAAGYIIAYKAVKEGKLIF